MSKKGIALCLVAFLVCIATAVWTQEKPFDRVASERLIAGVPVPSWLWIPESFKVSPDNRRVAYVAGAGNRMFVVVDGKEGKQYDGVASVPILSPDSKRVAYADQVGDKWVVLPVKKGKWPTDEMVKTGRIIFDSPDSLHYLVVEGNVIYLVEERIEEIRLRSTD